MEEIRVRYIDYWDSIGPTKKTTCFYIDKAPSDLRLAMNRTITVYDFVGRPVTLYNMSREDEGMFGSKIYTASLIDPYAPKTSSNWEDFVLPPRHGTRRGSVPPVPDVPKPVVKEIPPCWKALKINPDELPESREHAADVIRKRFREMAKSAHPDKGGSDQVFRELVTAREEALFRLGVSFSV